MTSSGGLIDSKIFHPKESLLSGPACYGSGGPLTITDVNLLLGRIEPSFFALPLHIGQSKRALEQLLKKVKQSTKKNYKAEEVLNSLRQIANEKMAEAIKKVSVV